MSKANEQEDFERASHRHEFAEAAQRMRDIKESMGFSEDDRDDPRAVVAVMTMVISHLEYLDRKRSGFDAMAAKIRSEIAEIRSVETLDHVLEFIEDAKKELAAGEE